MIQTKTAMAQLQRLSGLRYWPRDNDLAISELATALANAARSDAHASAIVSQILRSNDETPTPHEIYEIAASSQQTYERTEHHECASCQGTGFRPLWELHTYSRAGRKTVERITEQQYEELRPKVAGIGEQVVSCAVERCPDCNYGRRLAAAEQMEKTA